MGDEKFDIEAVLLEIRSDIKILKEDTNKNHEQLKSEFIAFKNNTNSQIRALDAAVKESNNTISEIKSDQHEVMKSQKFISHKYDETQNEMTKQKEKIVNLEKENSYLNEIIRKLDIKVNDNIIKNNELSQYIRRIMVEINGIPQTNEENIDETLKLLFELMNASELYDDIDVAHRLSNKRNSGIIIKFISRKSRDKFFNRRSLLKEKEVKDLGDNFTDLDEAHKKIFINESLTKTNRNLLINARQRCKEYNYKFCWSTNGVIFVREDESSKVIKIKNDGDIDRYII